MKILQILIFSVIFTVLETESTGNRPEGRRGRRMGTLFLILSFSHFSSLGPILYVRITKEKHELEGNLADSKGVR